jgi:hypothetical protein
MPKPVKVAIVFTRLLTISTRRYDDIHLMSFGFGYKGVAIVTFIRQQMLSVQPFDQSRGL